MRPPIKARKAQTTQVVSGDGLLVGVDTQADLEPVLQTTHCSGISSPSSFGTYQLINKCQEVCSLLFFLSIIIDILHVQTRLLVDESIQTYPLPLVVNAL